MKKYSLTLLLVMGLILSSLTVNAAGSVQINATNFPDATFRQLVKGYDSNKDNVLSETEAKSVTSISLQGSSITSLKGIEYFTELSHLDCSYNNITSLDLSKNTKLTYVRADNNKYTSLDVSKLTELLYLNTGGFSCTTVNVSGCTKLETFAAGAAITSLDLSNNTELKSLTLGGTITSLDLSKNTKLESIYLVTKCLKIIDVSNCKSLKSLSVDASQNLDAIVISRDMVLVDEYDKKNLYISGKGGRAIMYAGEGYSSEWVDGWWYNEDGSWSYPYQMSWKSDDTGWWIEDESGWYPTSCWQKIDYIWYYFDASGYMSADVYVSGCYLSTNGKQLSSRQYDWNWDGTGWKYQAIEKTQNGKMTWSLKSGWYSIDEKWYYFDKSGYMLSNQYVDGYWLGADGACE